MTGSTARVQENRNGPPRKAVPTAQQETEPIESGRYELAEEVFQLGAGACLGVAVFDDDSAGEGESPFLAGGMEHATGARDDDRVLGNDQWLFLTGRIDSVAHEIIHRNGAV